MTIYKDINDHLTLEGREKIQECLEKHMPVYQIARLIGFSDKGVHKEIARNSLNGKYGALHAHQLSILRKESHMAKARESIRHFNDSMTRVNTMEEEIQSIKTIIKTLSEIIEEIYDTINKKIMKFSKN